jgi:hypothetical protein
MSTTGRAAIIGSALDGIAGEELTTSLDTADDFILPGKPMFLPKLAAVSKNVNLTAETLASWIGELF